MVEASGGVQMPDFLRLHPKRCMYTVNLCASQRSKSQQLCRSVLSRKSDSRRRLDRCICRRRTAAAVSQPATAAPVDISRAAVDDLMGVAPCALQERRVDTRKQPSSVAAAMDAVMVPANRSCMEAKSSNTASQRRVKQ